MSKYGLPPGYEIDITNKRGTDRIRSLSAYKGEMRVNIYDISKHLPQREFIIPPRQPSLDAVVRCIEEGIRKLFDGS